MKKAVVSIPVLQGHQFQELELPLLCSKPLAFQWDHSGALQVLRLDLIMSQEAEAQNSLPVGFGVFHHLPSWTEHI